MKRIECYDCGKKMATRKVFKGIINTITIWLCRKCYNANGVC